MPHLSLTNDQHRNFHRDGFVVLPSVLDDSTVEALRVRVERLFRGEYETGVRPDEVNWQEADGDPSLTRQICNGWRADRTVAAIVGREDFGRAITHLMGWPGTRIMIDNVLWKPPGSKSLGFHQDNAYLPWFTPGEIATLWLALDDVAADTGPMEVVRGSHTWAHSIPNGEFHAPDDYRAPVEAAARAHGVAPDIVPITVGVGAGSIHHGWTWHGSGPNTGATHRRSLVLHAMSSQAQFNPDRFGEGTGPIYSRHACPGSVEMPESVFPVTWRSDGYRSPVLDP